MQKYIKQIKSLYGMFSVQIQRLIKKAHPKALRKNWKYYIARSNNGYVQMNSSLREYIDTLLRKSETPEHNFIIRSSEKGERSYLAVPLSQGRFLETFIRSIKAKHVLEIGTFKGFSTACMARGIQEGGIVFTCDEDSRPIPAARRFWQAMGVESKIHFEFGEAKKVLEKLTSDTPSLNFFDAVFIDADKENYQWYVIESMKLLKPGGTLLIDNTLWKGLVTYEHSGDNTAEHIKKFNEWMFTEFGRCVSFVPAWDGMLMCIKPE